MYGIRQWFPTSVLLALIALMPGYGNVARGAQPDAAQAGSASATYQHLVDEYFSGKWDQLQTDLKVDADVATLSAAQAADVAYIKATVAECQPDWWQKSKAGQKFAFRPVVWGRPMEATFDPAGKGAQFHTYNGVMTVTISWNVKDMDSPGQAEHGYTKGELNNLEVWANIGMGQAFSSLSSDAFVNQPKGGLGPYVEFRGDLAGIYYGRPRARQWGLWLYLYSYQNKYDKAPSIMGRRAIGAMFMAEVVEHSDLYPSIVLPNNLKGDGAEVDLATRLRDRIEHHPWTLAEDKSLRDAIKAFAAANGVTVADTNTVTLPNKLMVSLDSAADASNRAKRDAWLVSHLKN